MNRGQIPFTATLTYRKEAKTNEKRGVFFAFLMV